MKNVKHLRKKFPNSWKKYVSLHQLDMHQVEIAPSRLHQVDTAPSRNFTKKNAHQNKFWLLIYLFRKNGNAMNYKADRDGRWGLMGNKLLQKITIKIKKYEKGKHRMAMKGRGS